MAEETPTIEPSGEEKPTIEPSNEQKSTIEPSSEEKPTIEPSSDEPPTIKASSEQKPIEIVANPDYIKWEYPPYCELCNVYFNGESVSKTHFEGKNHKNRLHTWKKYQEPQSTSTNSKNVLCNICYKEMNTQLILDAHSKSPAHLKEVTGRVIVQKLKEEYKQLRNK